MHSNSSVLNTPEPENPPRKPLRFRVVRDHADIPKIVELAHEAHAESRFGYIPFSADKVRKIAERAIADEKRHAVMLAEKNGTPVGFSYCSVGEYHIGADVLLTTIHNINVSHDVRMTLSGGRVAMGLFRGIETWSQARGAQEILFHVTSDIDLARAHKLAKRMGFRFIGGSYAKTT